MKKYLILGIAFILIQLIGLYQNIQNGLEFKSIGYMIGFFIPGIIGIVSLIKYFKTK